jgi:hypothetical protein
MVARPSGLLQFFRTDHADIERIPQRSGLGEGECHTREAGANLGVDVVRTGVSALVKGAAIGKRGCRFGQGQLGINAEKWADCSACSSRS